MLTQGLEGQKIIASEALMDSSTPAAGRAELNSCEAETPDLWFAIPVDKVFLERDFSTLNCVNHRMNRLITHR